MQPKLNGSNFARWLGVLRRRGVWIPVCVLLAAAAAFAVSHSRPKRYTATASLLFKNNSFNQQIAGLPTNVGSAAEQGNSLRLVQFSNVAAATAAASAGRFSEKQLAESVSVSEDAEASLPGESSVIAVSASDKSPTLAAEVANAYAKQFVTQQRAANHQFFVSALSVVEKQLKAVPPHQRFSTAAGSLQSREQSLRLLAELQYGGVEVGRSALMPTSPSSPKTSRNTVIGGALGLLVGLCLVFLLEHLDGRLRNPDELEQLYGAPLLGAARASSSLSAKGEVKEGARRTLPPSDAASFGLMLAHLRSFNAGRDLRSVLIGSPDADEGKTTIALNLAEAAARGGARVLLLEANLRRPAIAEQLGIRGAPGLSAVLTGAMPLVDVVQSLELREVSGAHGARGQLDVLVAGAVDAADPNELLGSQRMAAMLDQAKLAYDLVVLDAAAMAIVPDAFSLVGSVDGVIAIGAVGRTRASTAEQLRHVLDGGQAPLVGVIANRVRARPLPSYAATSVEAGSPTTAAPAAMPAPEGSRHAARA